MKRIPVVLLLLGAIGCLATNDPGHNASVQVSFATQAQTAASPSRQPSFGVAQVNDTIIGTDTLVYTSVEIVLREIELKRVETVACDPAAGEDDPCERFEAGPVLVSLPLTPGAQQTFGLDTVPAATYSEVKLEVHKAEGTDTTDQAFLAAHPDFAGISIRVRGTFNSQAFEYTTTLDVEQTLTLVPQLVVADGVSTNITIFVDVSRWFVKEGVLMDPANPDRSVVDENIKQSFGAFEDRDHSGSHD
ncbi:MAG TPA: hypothetical protein VF902_07715 [Coriobacteriia bacterium]